MQSLSVTVVDIRPSGSLANPDGTFVQDTAVTTAAVGNWQAQIKAGDPAPDIDQRVSIYGAVTDYPFDRYTGRLEVQAYNADGADFPVVVTVLNTDPFFGINTNADASTGGAV